MNQNKYHKKCAPKYADGGEVKTPTDRLVGGIERVMRRSGLLPDNFKRDEDDKAPKTARPRADEKGAAKSRNSERVDRMDTEIDTMVKGAKPE
jgi:hypothetical protein